LRASKLKKNSKFFPQVFNKAAIFKIAKKTGFSTILIFALFSNLCLYFNQTHFIEDKFFLPNSRWRLMPKMAAEIQRSITLKLSNILTFKFAMSLYFCQQHEPANFVKLVKNGGSIQNGGPK
jgi:hypothetical protein